MDFDFQNNTGPLAPEPPRRMPAPWSVQKIAGGFVVVDAGGRRLAFVYADPDQHGANTDMLTPDEARRVARNIARLPELMGRRPPSLT